MKVNWFVAVFVVEGGFSGAVYGGAGGPDGFMLLFSVGSYRMWYDWVSEVWFVDSGGGRVRGRGLWRSGLGGCL